MRIFWGSVGVVGVLLAVIGTLLPVMPTVPFLIAAAYGFDRSSPRFHNMLMNHRVFGPQIREWREHGAISRRVKLIVCVSMAVGLCVSLFLLPGAIWLAQVTVVTLVAAYILTRPVPPHERV